MWVFDDERSGLRQEPFVCGASEAIKRIVQRRQLGDRLRMIFSRQPLPDPDAVLDLVRAGRRPCGWRMLLPQWHRTTLALPGAHTLLRREHRAAADLPQRGECLGRGQTLTSARLFEP